MGLSALRLATSSRKGLRAAAARGDLAERRVLAAARRIPSWWLLEARRATVAEDCLGYDVIVEMADLGRAILQVKSSAAAAHAFVEYGKTLRLRARIHVVVVEPGDCDAVVFGRVLGTVIKAREEALAAGVTADDPRLCLEVE